MKKFALFTAAAAMFLISGCGYKFGSLAHPQLESVAVAPVINDTIFYNASSMLRGFLSECVTVDGSLKLKDARKADCIIYARVTEVTYEAIGAATLPDGSDSFMPNEWRCKVSVQYSLVLPGRAKPLITNASVTGTSMFTNGPDLETSRQSAMRMALFSAAKNIVSGIVEGW